jgi:hypothetical protein
VKKYVIIHNCAECPYYYEDGNTLQCEKSGKLWPLPAGEKDRILETFENAKRYYQQYFDIDCPLGNVEIARF